MSRRTALPVTTVPVYHPIKHPNFINTGFRLVDHFSCHTPPSTELTFRLLDHGVHTGGHVLTRLHGYKAELEVPPITVAMSCFDISAHRPPPPWQEVTNARYQDTTSYDSCGSL
jgi:hypothetical protein